MRRFPASPIRAIQGFSLPLGFLLFSLQFSAFSICPVLAGDVYIAKGTNRMMTLSLTTLPPSSGTFTNPVQLTSSAGAQGAYVIFPNNGLVEMTALTKDVAVTGQYYSDKNGAVIEARNTPGTCLLASTNLTVFSVESISHPTVKWHRCNYGMPHDSALWWDYLYGHIGVALRPATNEVVGNLTVTVGDKTLKDANGDPFAGGDYDLDLDDTGWSEIKIPDTIVASWVISSQTAQLIHEVVFEPDDPCLELTISGGFDHVCTNGIHSSHIVTITDVNQNFPYDGSLTITLRVVTNGTGDAVFQSTGTHETNVTLVAYQATATVIGTTPGDGLTLEVHVSPGCEHAWDSRAFTNFNAGTLTLTDIVLASNAKCDVTQTNEDQTVNNALYLGQNSNATAQVGIDLTWIPPGGGSADHFRWEIMETNGIYQGLEWNPRLSAFTTGPATSTWTQISDARREFMVNGWFDCDGDTVCDEDEPHRRVYVTVVDTPWLTLSNPVSGVAVTDLTWTNEVAGTNNTLYLGETTNGNAQMTITFNWLPENVDSNWFRWKIALTNGDETTQWLTTNAATFSTNPVTLTWTNVPASGPTSREFRVDAWFDLNTNGTQEAWETHRQLFVTVAGCQIAMDANRDLVIDFDDPEDTTQGTNTFWVNDDHDTIHYEEFDWHEDDYSGSVGGAPGRNCDDNRIGGRGYCGGKPPAAADNYCLRDLEDFTVVQLKVPGVVSNLTGVTYYLKLENCQGTPSINLFKAITNGVVTPFDYLTNAVVATNQAKELKAYTITSTEQPISTNYINRYDQPIGFLMEGCATGKADLVFILKNNGSEICRSSVRLDLHEITDFYDVYKAYRNEPKKKVKWEADVTNQCVQIQTNVAYTADPGKYLLYIHGWNVTAEEKRNDVETVFKRLWWQKYKGGMGFYDWPTLYGCSFKSVFTGVSKTVHHFDDSEMISWLSATALTKLMEDLNTSGQLRVLAHSQGNPAMGEALQKYNGANKIKAYIATQAAMSGNMYDQNAPAADFSPNWYFGWQSCGPQTPQIYSYWYSGDASTTNQPYLISNTGKVERMCNYHNSQDFALGPALWEMNNKLKPDDYKGYKFWYGGSTNSYDETLPVTNRFYRDVNPPQSFKVATTNLEEKYAIFAYDLESWSVALGTASNSAFSFHNFNLRDAPLSYNYLHYSHSKQFRSNIVHQRKYYETLYQDCDF